jgi:hypothetical protein
MPPEELDGTVQRQRFDRVTSSGDCEAHFVRFDREI